MIGIEQWRAAIGCFHPKCVSMNFVTYDEGINVLFSLLCCLYTIVIICVKKLSFSCVYSSVLHAICSMKRLGEYLEVSTIFLAYLMIILLLCGDIETNPGPVEQKCPKCLSVVSVTKRVCVCGYRFRPNSDKSECMPQSKRRCPSKQCPVCASSLPSKKLICTCGYDFSKATVVCFDSNEKCKEQSRVGMASLRASESPEAASKRTNQSRVGMASLRASESPEAASKRTNQSRIGMASLRASESPEAASKCTNQSRVGMASLRASESPETALKRKEQSWICMSSIRNRVLSIDEAIDRFRLKIRQGPDFVCTVCHRMMYRLGVLPL